MSCWTVKCGRTVEGQLTPNGGQQLAEMEPVDGPTTVAGPEVIARLKDCRQIKESAEYFKKIRLRFFASGKDLELISAAIARLEADHNAIQTGKPVSKTTIDWLASTKLRRK